MDCIIWGRVNTRKVGYWKITIFSSNHFSFLQQKISKVREKQENSIINCHNAHQYKIINTLHVWLIKKSLNILRVSLKSISPLALRYNWQILYKCRCSTWWLDLQIHCEIFITTESQFLSRLISPGSPRRRKGSRALKKKKGVWGSQGEKDKLFSYIALS